ncbi:MAG: carbohydrate binding family 9 domain-containing protein [Saprospiraceae bacterium]|nr:carbohydrate binding family 9 domain-containing protein [Saprospiraceae bacterium]
MKNRQCIVLLSIVFFQNGLAQNNSTALNFPPPETPISIRAVKTSTKINLDGVLEEAGWLQAQTLSDFFRVEPKQGGHYDFSTDVKILFDEKNLYVGVFCRDSLGKNGVRVQDFRRDFTFGENDIFFFQLDPQNLRRYCVSFQTTPLGTQRDVQVFDDDYKDQDWDALWSVKTKILEDGWSAEFSIPFKSLRYAPPKAGGAPLYWGFTASRLARRRYEQTVFPPIPQAFSPYRMTYAARLEGLELPKPALNLRINPYLLYNYENRTLNDTKLPGASDPKIGGDAKWAINSHAVLDFTFNTDFAQADVDRAVNNLTRFNVFFPERRQFFLENSGVYPSDGGSIYPYFSRRIGLANSQFNAVAVPIDVGLRFNDRNEKRTLSGLYVHQRPTDDQGGANFALARFQKNLGKQNNLGAMFTYRFNEAGSGLPSNYNTTLTADFFLRPNDSWTINGLWSGSRDESLSQLGHAGNLYAGLNLNDWYAGWATKWVTKDYLPGMGFTFGNNVVHHNPGGYYIWRPKQEKSLIRRADPGFFVNYYHSASDGKFQQADIYLFPVYLFFRDNSFFEVSLYPTWQNIDFNFAPLDIPIEQGRYFYTPVLIQYNTDQSRKLSGTASVKMGKFYNGTLLTLNTNLRIAPTPHAAFTLDYELNRARSLGQKDEDKDVHLYSGGLRLALNPQLQGTVFYQYNSLDKTGRWNARVSWEYRPLSFVYLVFNDTRSDLGMDRFRTTGAIAKMNWMRQF